MLKIHAEALSSKIASYHEFLARFSKNKNVVYGFVEGKEDPCFYRGFIEHIIPEDWEVELWPAGNRNQVIRIHKDIDWRRFPKKRVCFFIDRDLSDLIPEKLPNDINIYITDKYSIENSIVNRRTCSRILTEVFGFSGVNHNDLEIVCNKFEAEYEKFLLAMIPIMAQILYWRRSQINANLNNINISKIFTIQKASIILDNSADAESQQIKYLHKTVGAKHNNQVDLSSFKAEFSQTTIYRKYVRGKYVLWFLIEYCKSIHKNATIFFSECNQPPKINVTISASNAIVIIGNRARVPQSLQQFFTDTFCAYIMNTQTKA
ncbi:MAG: DUF4435 domain-containing protein [Chlorobiaceae bacterium]|nr:DUF4435 domain-containing protein [Chlorobiaceae bacterium]